MRLQQGKTYAADVVLEGLQAAFGTVDAVAKSLRSAGFSSVSVIRCGHGRFRASGLWPAPSRDVTLPSQVSNVREV